jgi:hydroxypyruvate reductase
VAAPTCLVAGGETTVTLRGAGRGGRNQELALAAALAWQGVRGVALLAAGTDGSDGPTDAAGAFADGGTVGRGARRGADAAASLDRNDSHGFFAREGGLFQTGPTGTNVMDITLVAVQSHVALPPASKSV